MKRAIDPSATDQDAVTRLHLDELTSDPALSRITRLAARCLRVSFAAFSIPRNGNQVYVASHGFPTGELPEDDSITARAIAEDRLVNVADARSHPHYRTHPAVERSPFIRFFAAYPIHEPEGSVIGVLAVFDSNTRYLDADEMADLRMFAQLMESALLTRHAAMHDELTGLYNRRHFGRCVELEWRRAQRHLLPLTFVIMDLDFFKTLNDSYGHAAGDETLAEIGMLLRRNFRRRGDVVARYGGEEFSALLPATSALQAVQILDEVRAAVWGLNIPNPGSKSGFQTISIGIASIDMTKSTQSVTSQRMLGWADKALYAAKSSGRNCIALCDKEGECEVVTQSMSKEQAS